MMRFFFVFLILCIPLQVVFGATNNFTIRTLVGSDTQAPTTPFLTSAVPASTSQIDIAWSASTDNFVLGGYQVFRNTVQIATTTLTTYSDGGLLQGTTYTYSVRAFDSVFNYSSTSNSLATTTLTPPATTTATTTVDSSTTGSKIMALTTFSIIPKQYSALFSWKTTNFAKFDLRWGRTTSYELGFVSHDLLKKGHETEIADLRPGATYEYELIGYNRFGKETVLKRGNFTTLSAPDTTAPANVSNLSAYVIGNDVHLSWQNPKDADFDRVRVIRNYLFFPSTGSDGFLTYDGDAELYTDKSALSQSRVQYYTVFTLDALGNSSSGAVIAVARDGGSVLTPDTAIDTDPQFKLLFSQFEFVQNGEVISEKGIDNTLPFTVRIAYEYLPEHLKTLTASFKYGADGAKPATYLMKLNADKTFYEAVVPRAGYTGLALTTFTMYDFETKTMQTAEGSVLFYGGSAGINTVFSGTLLTTIAVESEFVTLLFLLLLIIFFFILSRFFTVARRKR